MINRWKVCLLIALLTLAGCGGGVATEAPTVVASPEAVVAPPTLTGADPAVEMVMRYLTAKVNSDSATLAEVLCSEREAQLPNEVNSFASVQARLENVECTRVEGADIVACTGSIMALYDAENREFPLSSYRVLQEDGDWKWCGESE